MQEIEDRSTDWYFFLGFNTIIRQKGSKNGTLCGFGDPISITRDLYIQLADKLRGGYQNEQNLITLRLRRTTHPSGVWKGKGKVGLDLCDHFGPVPVSVKTTQKDKPFRVQQPHLVCLAWCHSAKSVRMHELGMSTKSTYIHQSSIRSTSRSIPIVFRN